jgi:hypothetical protein
MQLSRDLWLHEDSFGATAGRSLEPTAGEDNEADFSLISAPASPYGSSPRSALAFVASHQLVRGFPNPV